MDFLHWHLIEGEVTLELQEIENELKKLADSVAGGELDDASLSKLAENFDAVEEQSAQMNEASKLRYLALQPFIAEGATLPDLTKVDTVMKNWGRQGGAQLGGEAITEGSVLLKNWGRQGK